MYSKVGDGDTWLEYHASSKEWQVKPSEKGKGKAWAWVYCAVPAKCLPEECPVGQWQVRNDGKWEAQIDDEGVGPPFSNIDFAK